MMRVVPENTPQALTSIREVFKFIIDLTQKDSNLAVLWVSRIGSFQCFQPTSIVFFDEELVTFLDQSGEMIFIFAAKGIQECLLTGLKFFTFLAFQKTLRHPLVPVAF